jgi:hypothetical protein
MSRYFLLNLLLFGADAPFIAFSSKNIQKNHILLFLHSSSNCLFLFLTKIRQDVYEKIQAASQAHLFALQRKIHAEPL